MSGSDDGVGNISPVVRRKQWSVVSESGNLVTTVERAGEIWSRVEMPTTFV